LVVDTFFCQILKWSNEPNEFSFFIGNFLVFVFVFDIGYVNAVHRNITADEYIITTTKLGQVQGKIHNIMKDNGSQEIVYEYRNIPYAQPPVGALRWRPPLPARPWKGVLPYKSEQIWCKQFFHGYERGTEDCLVLTIRQSRSSVIGNKSLPVLFWIHGGALNYGSSDWYYPDEQCSASLEMITVSINYRLNLFGFLSIKELWEKGEYDGNYGIMDIILALKWVRDNIASFGGNPDKVTLLGQSAGGAAIYSLIASPSAAGLFHKAIPASGYPVNLASNKFRAEKKFGNYLRKITGCERASEVGKCLRSIPTDSIIRCHPALRYPIKSTLSPWFFPYNEPADIYPMRVVGDKVVPEPIGLIRKAHTPGLKILIGNTAQEGHPVQQAETWKGMEKHLKPKIDSFVTGIYPTLIKLYESEVNGNRDRKNVSRTTNSQEIHMKMTSDVLLGCQTNEIARNLSQVDGIIVYRYVQGQPFSFNPWDKFQPYAYHGIDTDALFGFKHALYKPTGYRPKPTKKDWKLVTNVRKLIHEFVYEDKNFHEKYNGKTIEFKEGRVETTIKDYHENKCKVWKNYGFLKRSWGQLNLNVQKQRHKFIQL